jgi:hypothetical protein
MDKIIHLSVFFQINYFVIKHKIVNLDAFSVTGVKEFTSKEAHEYFSSIIKNSIFVRLNSINCVTDKKWNMPTCYLT